MASARGLVVESLARRHDRSKFNSGNAALDRYLEQQAGQDARRFIATPFVLVEGDDTRVLGYYTLSQTALALADLPQDIARRLPRYPIVPATRLGRLAVDRRCQGRGFGKLLLIDAMAKSLQTVTTVASFALVVDAKDDSAVEFYKSFEFRPISGAARTLFRSMAMIARLLAR